jgi:DNA helicase IV
LMIVGDPNNLFTAGVAEKQNNSSNWVKINPFSNPDKRLEHLDKNYRSYSQIIEFNNDFFKLLSNEFEHLDYKDLYENHSHQNK